MIALEMSIDRLFCLIFSSRKLFNNIFWVLAGLQKRYVDRDIISHSWTVNNLDGGASKLWFDYKFYSPIEGSKHWSHFKGLTKEKSRHYSRVVTPYDFPSPACCITHSSRSLVSIDVLMFAVHLDKFSIDVVWRQVLNHIIKLFYYQGSKIILFP